MAVGCREGGEVAEKWQEQEGGWGGGGGKGGGGKDFIVGGVGGSQGVLRALNRALALHSSLAGKAHEGNLGQAAILHFLLLGVLTAQAQGVKGNPVQEPRLQANKRFM